MPFFYANYYIFLNYDTVGNCYFLRACINFSLGIKKYVYELIPKIHYLKTIHRLLLKFIIIFWQTGSSAMNMSCL